MTVAILLVLIAIVVGYFLLHSTGGDTGTNQRQSKAFTTAAKQGDSGDKKVRLTEQQIIALSCADPVKPIYGENPSHMYSQMPNDAHCFNIRTIESLAKRGYLRPDSKGGYLITREGEDALRSPH